MATTALLGNHTTIYVWCLAASHGGLHASDSCLIVVLPTAPAARDNAAPLSVPDVRRFTGRCRCAAHDNNQRRGCLCGEVSGPLLFRFPELLRTGSCTAERTTNTTRQPCTRRFSHAGSITTGRSGNRDRGQCSHRGGGGPRRAGSPWHQR